MSKPQLILHIGIHKTGSSYIQSSLALSRDNLDRNGIFYPDNKTAERARAGHVTAGNLSTQGNWTQDILDITDAFEGPALLFSAEGLSRELVPRWDDLRPVFARFHLKIIAFCRDPVSQVLSHKAQQEKRAGLSVSVTEFLRTYKSLEWLSEILLRSEQLGAEVVLMNYSKRAQTLLPSLSEALGVSPGDLIEPPLGRVNRGLSRSEHIIQEAFNRHYGPGTGNIISDALCNELPDVAPAAPAVTRQDYDAIVQAVEGDMCRINTRLSAQEQMRLEPFDEFDQPTDPEAPITLSVAQVDVLAKSISSVLSGERRFIGKDGQPLVPPQRQRDAFARFLARRRANRGKLTE
ncbi:MAG: hypothetical protein MK160_01730 [Rhodobacteraceae bacterium]|nr:hypothetical protein [Paracoccaceae bacterium]